jgi:hypothetical protein
MAQTNPALGAYGQEAPPLNHRFTPDVEPHDPDALDKHLRGALATAAKQRDDARAENKQLRAENELIRKSISDGDYGPTAAELQRFRDREEKVRELVSLLGDPALDLNCALRDAIAAVRDFKVQP